MIVANLACAQIIKKYERRTLTENLECLFVYFCMVVLHFMFTGS